MSWLKRNVVMLSTEKATKQTLMLHIRGGLRKPFETDKDCQIYNDNHFGDNGYTPHNLYFLSDEKPEKDDWCISIGDIYYEGLSIEEHNPRIVKYTGEELGVQKIIATTNKSLNINTQCETYQKKHCGGFCCGIPQPSQQFVEKYIEEYNKGNVITEVMVEYEELWKSTVYDQPDNYIGEALKVNLKDNTINIMLIKDSWNWKELKALFDSYGDNHAAQIIWNDIQNL